MRGPLHHARIHFLGPDRTEDAAAAGIEQRIVFEHDNGSRDRVQSTAAAGENIAAGRWTASRKARIRDSRVKGTRLIAETMARIEKPPQVIVSASAIGYYGDRGSELLREDSPPGNGFLSDVCRQWEAATDAAKSYDDCFS